MTQAPLSVAARIARAQPSFSRIQHQMAEYVLAHQFRVATMTIDEFAAAAGVSVASANRFARALDLPGYPQFRAELARGFESALEPVEKMRVELAHSATAAQVMASALEEDIRNAQRTLQELDPEACERAVDMVLAAERVFIIGFGSSGFLAGLLQRGLYMHLHACESLAGPGGVSHAARQMVRMTSRDLVIAIGFPRYLADTVTLSRAAINGIVRSLAESRSRRRTGSRAYQVSRKASRSASSRMPCRIASSRQPPSAHPLEIS